MPFVANTPESLLGRADSKNPASTCHGITSSGRPCRRPITAVPRGRGLKVDLAHEGLYCWQHKEQASHSTQSSPGPKRHHETILEERSSIDTLADRLGLVDLGQKPLKKPKPARSKPPSKLQCCFCFSLPLDEVQPPPRPRSRPRPQMSASMPELRRPPRQSPTAQLKRLIPNSVDAATASALLAELTKPLADEPGYIYMFWLTPASKAHPPVDAARSLLAPPSPTRSRRPSDIVSEYTGQSKATMLLKIGRAANVQRRMNQWQRQCGYDIEMLRYYPYVQTAAPRTTPHCRRVERLIHIELAGMGLKAAMGACETCGRDHREWFEVRATREGVRSVDEVVRRWVAWDEGSTS